MRHQYGANIAKLELDGHKATLDELLDLGGDPEKGWSFDVTPSGCVQSTMAVVAKSTKDHRADRIRRLRAELVVAEAG